MELISIDYEIIEYISKFNEISLDDILNKFPDKKFSTSCRIKSLSENYGYIQRNYIDSNDGYGGTLSLPSNSFSITDFGRKELYDYKILAKEKFWDKFWKIFSVIISLLALAVSNVALYCQFFRK